MYCVFSNRRGGKRHRDGADGRADRWRTIARVERTEIVARGVGAEHRERRRHDGSISYGRPLAEEEAPLLKVGDRRAGWMSLSSFSSR